MHLAIVPIIWPLILGAVLVLLRSRSLAVRRSIALLAVLGCLTASLMLGSQTADGSVIAYLVGNWRAPFGIALAVDRFAVLLLALTAVVALVCWASAIDGDDARGPHFHALLCFQLMGLNGAFLTADLFNLFVFFEVLLISSYALLLHGADGERVRAATHYVVVNLMGSALFLLGVTLLYGLTGTLNLADLAVKIAQLPAADIALAHSAALLLLVVFCLKGAMLPLYFWLPDTYRAAPAPVAALFAIMTKVGVYAVVRVFTLLSGGSAAVGGPPVAFNVIEPWLLPFGLATLTAAAVAAFAARDLRGLMASLVIGSAGTAFATFGLSTPAATAAALYYLAHSTLSGAAAFLLVGAIRLARGAASDRLVQGPQIGGAAFLGAMYVVIAITLAGLPPLSGFIAKLGVLTSARGGASAAAVWVVVLGAGLLSMVALMRAGSLVFWRPMDVGGGVHTSAIPAPRVPLEDRGTGTSMPATAVALSLALACGVALVVFAAPVQRYLVAAAAELHAPQAYMHSVLGTEPVRKRVLVADPAEELR